MNTVEKNLTQNNIELMNNNPEFEKRQEDEGKYITYDMERFEQYRAEADPIDQLFLSHPAEEFSLRVRAQYTPEGVEYTGALKGPKSIYKGKLRRLQVETPISQQAFEYYSANPAYPHVYKHRAEPSPGCTVDFIKDLDTPLIETEDHPLGNEEFNKSFTEGLIDVTDDPRYENEKLAHWLAGEKEYTPESLDDFATRVVREMVARYVTGDTHVVVGISGMSGSGKSSAVKEIARQLQEVMGAEFAPSILSTDDYHRGKKWLEKTYGAPWTNWDDPRVYNTKNLARDLEQLASGHPIIKGRFDFGLEETVDDGPLSPATFTIVEGIMAGSPDLNKVRQLHFEVPTSPATSIGRDVRRLLLENRANEAFPTPEARLAYQLEVALPTYQEQQRPKRNAFPAYCPPMGERAIYLTRLEEWRKNQ